MIRHVFACAFIGTEVNATVIGENDPIDEVQGFLFGKLRYVYSFGKCPYSFKLPGFLAL